MQYLRQSTASQEISLGYFLDSTDGDTEETGLTIGNTDIKLRKGGATSIVSKNSGGATHMSNGIYSAVLDATDTSALGMLEVYVHVSGALATKNTYMVLPAATYDALVTNGLNNIAATDIVSAGAITTLSGAVVNVDLVDTCATNTDMRGTDSALLAASAPSNWSSMVVSGSGAVDALTQGYLNTLLTETTAGRIAGNFDTFFENADAATTKVVDDVGGAGGAGDWTASEKNEIRGRLGITGTTSAGGNAPTLSTQASIDALNDIAATDIVSAGAITTLSGAVVNVDLVDTCTNNTDMRGTDGANTTAPDNAGITANGNAIAALNDLSSAEVNTEILDVLTVDTFAEPSSVPAATSSIKDKLSWLFTTSRNKTTSTATTLAVRNDLDNSDIGTALQSDDGTTYTKNEWS